MDIFYLVGACAIFFLSIGFAIITNKIIADQDRELNALKEENQQLKKENKAKKQVKVYAFYEQPKGYDIPDFKEW